MLLLWTLLRTHGWSSAVTALAESEPYVRWLLLGVLFMVVSICAAAVIGRLIGAGSEREASHLMEGAPMRDQPTDECADIRSLDGQRSLHARASHPTALPKDTA